MIADEQQEQAALYALDLLSAEEAAAFERQLAANSELETLTRELRDVAGSIALSLPQVRVPSAVLKNRIMQQLATDASRATTATKIITPPVSAFRTWAPWAIAAAFMIFCGALALDRAKLSDRLARERAQEPTLVALAPSEDGPQKAQGIVAWNAERQTGTIKIQNLPVPARGKDYQLWAVDGEHKDPISAGIVHVEAGETVQVEFKPRASAHSVKAFAISLERAGGVEKKEGPILLAGKI